MATTYDIERSRYTTEWVPTEAEVPADHWSNSSEWLNYLKAKADATRLYPLGSVHGGRIAETDAMKLALAAFEAKYPAKDEPTPVQPLSPRAAELRAAEINLRQAVSRMRVFSHLDRIVQIVQTCE